MSKFIKIRKVKLSGKKWIYAKLKDVVDTDIHITPITNINPTPQKHKNKFEIKVSKAKQLGFHTTYDNEDFTAIIGIPKNHTSPLLGKDKPITNGKLWTEPFVVKYKTNSTKSKKILFVNKKEAISFIEEVENHLKNQKITG